MEEEEGSILTEEVFHTEELEKARRDYLYAFHQLKQNDPCCYRLRLSSNWKQALVPSDIDLFLEALTVGGSFLRKVHVHTRVIEYENELPVLHEFIATSTQLQHLEIIQGSGQRVEEAQIVNKLLDAMEQSDSISSLSLKNIRFIKGNLLPRLLSKTTSLKELTIRYCSVDSQDTGEELLCSLGDNQSLERLTFQTLERKLRLCALLHGIYDHEGLRHVNIHVNHCTRDECELLGRYIQANHNVEHLSFSVSRPRVNPDLNLASILQGVQNNHALKYLKLRVDDPIPCQDAWRKMLTHNKTLEELDLNSCKLAGENVSGIAAGLSNNTSLKRLNLSHCLYNALEAQASTFHAENWRDMLLKNKTLEYLNLCGGMIGDQGITVLAHGLRHNRSLQQLDLSVNSITTESFLAVVEAANATLQTLDVSYNEISHGSLLNVLRQTNIKNFDFSRNRGDSWLDNNVLAAALSENNVMESIVLDRIELSDFRAQALWEALRNNTSVQSLSLNFNRIDLQSFGDLFTRMLHENRHLVMLDLSFCESGIVNQGLQALASGLERNECLQRLLVNIMDDEALIVIGQALQENSTLEHLTLTEPLSEANTFTEEGIRDFFRCLANVRGLKEIDFLDLSFSLSEETGLVLLESLRENTVIETIYNVQMCFLDFSTRQLIEFYLELNRRGRRWIERRDGPSDIDIRLWPHILAKLSSPQDLRYMSYFLHQKLELVIQRPPLPSLLDD